MEETYFTRKAEDIYGPQAVEWTRAYFDSESVTEAFFAASAQIDMLVEEHDVNVWDAEFRNIDDEKWTPEKILDAADEIAMLAHQQKSGVWPVIASFAACMRAMFRTAPICPSGSFVAKKDQKVPPGMIALLEREDLKPADLLVAAIVEDLGTGTATAAAVSAERETCIAIIQDQIDKAAGEGQTPEGLEIEAEKLDARLSELCDELEQRDPSLPDDEVKTAEIARVEDEVEAIEFKVHVCDLLKEVHTAIVARRPAEPEDNESASEKTDAGTASLKPYLARQFTLTPVPLPFREDALEPVLSTASVAAHYDQYVTYCDKARRLTLEAGGTGEERLEDLVRWATGEGNDSLFNQAAQAWNHAFLWLSFKGRRQCNDDREDRDGWSSRLGDAASDSGWADLGALRRDMTEAVATSFGSAWVWLVLRNGRLAIEVGKNAATPIADPVAVPLLVVDAWEHAYFLDYGFNRARYAKAVVGLLDWDFAALRVTQHDDE